MFAAEASFPGGAALVQEPLRKRVILIDNQFPAFSRVSLLEKVIHGHHQQGSDN